MVVGTAVRQLLSITMATEGPDADMTETVKPLERWARVEVGKSQSDPVLNATKLGPVPDISH